MQRRTDRLQEVLRQKADAFFSLEGAVLAGDDPEAIHDMRVASRRLQEVLRLVFTEGPAFVRMIRAVRRARRAQSTVRDLDVMAERLGKMARGARGDARAALQWILKMLTDRRARRHRKLTDAVRALDLAGLRRTLDGRMSRLSHTRAGEDALAEVTLRARAQVSGRAEAFAKAVAEARVSARPDDLHAARVAGKRLRYLLEICDEFRVGGFKKRIAQMRAIQQALGRWHDLEVLGETVTGLFADRETFRQRLPLVRAACGLIAGWRAEQAAHLREFLRLTEAVETTPGGKVVGSSRRARI